VAGRVGGIPEIVRDGVNGRLVNPRDSKGLSVEIADLLLSGKGKEYGANGKRIVKQMFSVESMVDGYDTLYERVCARTGIHN
jgi:glycosyltransferase involved in cell wall biosynthesis